MTKEEFLSLETGDIVRVDYNGVVCDYVVASNIQDIVLTPVGLDVAVPRDSAEKWNLAAMTKRKGKATKPKRKTEATEEE